MYSLDTDNYLFDVRKLLKAMLLNLNKICYISLDKSGESVYEFCKENNIDINKVFIVDMISARFKKCKSSKRMACLEVNGLEKQLKLIIGIIKKNKCSAIIIDSLSTMQIYYPENEFVKFAHELLVYTESQHIISNLIIQKKDVEKDWVKSLMPLVGEAKEVKFSI